MSLAENLARRRHRGVELAKEIASLKERGYDHAEIARKTDLPETYVRGIIRLLSKGETRLLQAVEGGQIPITIAVTIASSDDATVQRALAEAYDSKSIRGKALLKARRLVELRRSRGKNGRASGQSADDLSSRQVLQTYQHEMNRQRLLVNKAKVGETRLLFIVSALKSLLGDEAFVNLLRAESLNSLPQYLAEQVNGKAAAL
jgi:ParB family chromosome partitioning protein